MVKIKWSKESIEDLIEIHHYISQDSPHYARVFIERIVEITEHLEYFPAIGRRVPETDNPIIKEIFYRNYRIIYQIKSNILEIITVIHGRRILKI